MLGLTDPDDDFIVADDDNVVGDGEPALTGQGIISHLAVILRPASIRALTDRTFPVQSLYRSTLLSQPCTRTWEVRER